MSTFEGFPKIPRLSKTAVITEKLDGTNAQILICATNGLKGIFIEDQDPWLALSEDGKYVMAAGSRNRFLDTSSKGDNFGFAKWVQDNADELFKLGEGRHFGEWWGQGVGRGYGVGTKRLSLFNTARWGSHNPNTPSCVSVVPVIARVTLDKVDDVMLQLKQNGSYAAPGFMNPEGIIVYYERQLFKKTFEHDTGKWQEAA